jgi:hypothetical protein
MGTHQHRWRIWGYIVTALVVPSAVLAFYVGLHQKLIEEHVRQLVVQELMRRFDSPVELKSFHVQFWPTVQVQGRNLSLLNRNRPDAAPLLRVEEFSFHLGAMGIFRAPRHIHKITVKNMAITIPPPGTRRDNSLLHKLRTTDKFAMVIDELICDDTDLIILPKNPAKEPLDFDIHNLVLKDIMSGSPIPFWGTLTNAKPKGEIATQGNFGPWDGDEPRNTAVAGAYEFTNADLDPFPGIGGTLSSKGKYSGQLDHIDVQGTTDTPNFSLDPVGHRVPLHTDFSATVDGTDGDTYLHPVRAVLGHSVIVANGSVVRAPNKQGHLITLDVVAPEARLEDILSLAMKSDKPTMTGVTNIKTQLVIVPGKMKTLERLRLNGEFTVKNANFSSADVQQKLESLSRHALGKPNNQKVGSAVSDMSGHFQLNEGQATFQNLRFAVEGAEVRLDGSYGLRNEILDFEGQLRLQATLSQLTTGMKSLLLKPVDPFYRKNGAGAEIPIGISGTRENPTIEVKVLHRTIKKQFAAK